MSCLASRQHPGFWCAGRILAGIGSGHFVYHVTVDTSALNGQSGYVDFQFNPGDSSAELATAAISNLSPVANLNPSDPGNSSWGTVTGSLTSTLTLTNDFSDFFEAFSYGNSISFDLVLSGPAVNSPSSTIGSAFAFSLYAADGASPLLTIDSSGSVLTVYISSGGTTSVQTFPQSFTESTPVASADPVSAVPAPCAMVLLASALPMGVTVWWKKKKGQRKRKRTV